MGSNRNNINELQRLLPLSSGVTTDNRKGVSGRIFFALKGDNFDGNDYAEAAVSQGAICAVVGAESEIGRKVLAGSDGETIDTSKYVVFDDTLKALQDLARWHRQQFDIPVIALTGTNGKTTTKELLNVVLSVKFRVTATQGNLNNHIGVPLTLFNINKDTGMAVIEMGASSPGEIETLVDIALPDYGLITNVGKAHIQGFGSFEGVKKAKGELYDYLQAHDGIAFINADNPHLCEMADSRHGMRTIPYGCKFQGAAILPVDGKDPFLHMEVPGRSSAALPVSGGRVDVRTHLVGSYNADNVLAALCVGEHFGIMPEESAAAIAGYYPSNSRSQLKQTGKNLLILDTYNANPSSMRASLGNFGSTRFEHKVLILGDMLELGADSRSEHQAILDLVKGMDIEDAYLVGSEFGALNVGDSPVFHFFDTAKDLMAHFQKYPITGKTVLLKGSNGIRLQTLEESL